MYYPIQIIEDYDLQFIYISTINDFARYYPGEIDEIAARRDIGDSIVQELQIIRISSNESTIEEMK